jgi:C4-dicarboxylate-specific signal transduction histidine kinase
MARRSKSLSSTRLQLLVCAFSLALLILLWLAAASQVRLEKSAAIDAAIRENNNRAAAFEQYVARTLETAAGGHLSGLSNDCGDQPSPAPSGRASGSVGKALAGNPLLAHVMVADERGNVRCSTQGPTAAATLESDPVFRRFQANPADEGIVISDPVTSPQSPKPLIALTRAIQRRDGRFGGIASVWIEAERLVDFNKGATNRPLDLISVIRLDGLSLARRQGAQVTFGQDLRGKRVMAEQAANPNGTYLGPSGLDGIRRYFSHRRLAKYGVFVTVGIGEEDVLADIRSRSRIVIIGMLALTAAILAFAVSTVVGLRRNDRAAQETVAANRRLSEAQRIGTIGDWEYDLRDGKVYWSEQLCRMYGRDTQQDVLSVTEASAYYSPGSQDLLRTALEQVIERREPQQCEIGSFLAEGAVSFRRIRIVPRLGADGSVASVVGTEQDVTSEKEHERLRDEVAHMARVEAMNAMAVTIAHELAQPLTAASNYLSSARQFARRGAVGDELLVSETLEQVERQIAFTRDIVRRARDMIGKRRVGSSAACLPEVIDDAVSLVRLVNKHSGVEIVQRSDPAARFVGADAIQIQQVVVNLLTNAVEAASGSEAPQVVVTSGRRPDGTALISVADNGPGISPEMEDIFSPFSSGKGGLGLGLALSRVIVHSFGGRIWVDQTEAQGARICFSLPLTEAADQHRAKA